jgi:hypothetical protein
VSGGLFGAQADCGCMPNISAPTCFSCNSTGPSGRDLDRSEATCQGAYNYGPTTPWVMSAPSL